MLGYETVPKSTQDFVSLAQVLDLDKAVIEACIALRKQRKIKLPDTIIAATALVHNRTVVSRNTSDFKNIDGLTCVNPYDC